MTVFLSSIADPTKVATALRALARDMDDPYLLPDETLARALADTHSTTGAVLAELAEKPVGVVLYSIFLSTTRGKVGAFVTDLWVDKSQRGTGLGRRMLARVRDEVSARWGGTFLRLNYYHDNSGAAAFYKSLGFHPNPQEVWVTLEGQDLERLE